MESKKANLLIDISKNIVEQYRKQLANSVEISKQEDLDVYSHENFVDRAGRCVGVIDKFLDNYDASIFDGEVLEDKTVRYIYTRNGREEAEVRYVREFSKEERELIEAKEGIDNLFHFIGIPSYSMSPIIADIITRFQDKNYRGGKVDEEFARIRNERFNVDGKYDVGELKFNNTLSSHIVFESGAFRRSNLEENRYLYEAGVSRFVLDSLPIFDIVNQYVIKELNDNAIEGLEEQNKKVENTMDLVTRLVHYSSDPRIEYSAYYYDYFRGLEKYPIENYFTQARVVEKHDFRKEELEQAKDNISRLNALTIEENQLLTRLNEIQDEKVQILGIMNRVDGLVSNAPKEEGANRQYIDQYHYVENGEHYHLPNWENNERHTQLK